MYLISYPYLSYHARCVRESYGQPGISVALHVEVQDSRVRMIPRDIGKERASVHSTVGRDLKDEFLQ